MKTSATTGAAQTNQPMGAALSRKSTPATSVPRARGTTSAAGRLAVNTTRACSTGPVSPSARLVGGGPPGAVVIARWYAPPSSGPLCHGVGMPSIGVSVVDVLEVVGVGAAGFLVVALVCAGVLAMLQVILPSTDSGAAELDARHEGMPEELDTEPNA